ncbi:hypothetical protein DFAR_1700007 [Desulfarculales bacterium]
MSLSEKNGPACQASGTPAEDVTILDIAGLGDDVASNLRGRGVLNLVTQKKGKRVLFNCPFLGIQVDTPPSRA